MRMQAAARLFILAMALLCSGIARANPAPAPAPAAALAWPKSFQTGEAEVLFYQPQVDSWAKYATLQARCAVEVRFADGSTSRFGSVFLEARTQVNAAEHRVLLSGLQVQKVFFPGADADTAARCERQVRTAILQQPALVVSLDHLLAVTRQADRQPPVSVGLTPPPVYYSDKPAILIVFTGTPKFQMIPEAGLLFAVNTNWDLFLDPATSRYYLLYGDSWLTAPDALKGPWSAAGDLPAGLSRLPDNDNWQNVRARIPGQWAATVPAVITSTVPAELIVTDGAPQFEPIPGTRLLSLSNTASDIFLYADDAGSQFYILLAGRWFRAPALTGPWASATLDLPAEFARIPADGPRASVRTSVPGTIEAQTAVLLASVPTIATVQRADLKLQVVYDGAPVFRPIEGTKLTYAVNTSFTVLHAEGRYYCCQQGVWFVAGKAEGPWEVATSVPAVIYTIPPSSPLYNVTYVTVYSATDTQVVTGYTSGYVGEYVMGGLVMFGLGLAIGSAWNDDWGCYHYSSHYYSYGCGARFSYVSGTYIRAGSVSVYGPYGGVGHIAAYNAATGTYVRGTRVYGPAGSYNSLVAYNPSTGFAAAHQGGSNLYGSWGRSVVTNGDDWARTAHHTGAAGGIAGIQTSGGNEAVVAHTARGNTDAIGKAADGDIYAGRDGNLYKKTPDGNWQKYDNGNWQPATRDNAARPAADQPRSDNREGRTGLPEDPRVANRAPGETRDPAAQPAQLAPVSGDTERRTENRRDGEGAREDGRERAERSGGWDGDEFQQLQRESEGRQRGNDRARDFDESRSFERDNPGRFFGGQHGRFRR